MMPLNRTGKSKKTLIAKRSAYWLKKPYKNIRPERRRSFEVVSIIELWLLRYQRVYCGFG